MNPLIRVTYQDAYIELDPEDDGPVTCLNTVVGFDLGEHNGYRSIAAEYTPYGYRAVTHVPSTNVLLEETLTWE